jgi:hypothetical protein
MDAELPKASLHDLDVRAGLLLELCRHTGGHRLLDRSDRALVDLDGLHSPIILVRPALEWAFMFNRR